MNECRLKYQFETGINITNRINYLPSVDDKYDVIDYIECLEQELADAKIVNEINSLIIARNEKNKET